MVRAQSLAVAKHVANARNAKGCAAQINVVDALSARLEETRSDFQLPRKEMKFGREAQSDQ
jgi:hypothetical protein